MNRDFEGFYKFSLIIFAFAFPIVASKSEISASLIRLMLLYFLSNTRLVVGHIPLISSSAEATWCLLRFSRWKVMA